MLVNAVLHNDLEQTAHFASQFARLKVWDQALFIAHMRAEVEQSVSIDATPPEAGAVRTWRATDCVSAGDGIKVRERTVAVRVIGSPPMPPPPGASAEDLVRKYASELAVFSGAFGLAEQPAQANRDRFRGEGAVSTTRPTVVVNAQTASAAKRFRHTLEWLHRAYNEGGQGTC
jgi:hypothetical protein